MTVEAMMENGFSITIDIGDDISFYEVTVKPPGIQVGSIPITTQRNVEWRTFAAKILKTLTETVVKGGYNPAQYDEIESILGDNRLITVNFPDGSKVKFWGWLDEWDPDELAEGTFPQTSLKFVASNRNGSKDETGPTYVTPA